MHNIPDTRGRASRRSSSFLTLSAAALISLAPLAAEAGDKHHHHHRHKGGEYKEQYWDGACKVERKWKRNGEYREKRKCHDGYAYGYPQPVAVPMMPVAPAIVIAPPAIIIRP